VGSGYRSGAERWRANGFRPTWLGGGQRRRDREHRQRRRHLGHPEQRAVSFVDPNNGWAVGGSGTILHTSDGGVTWTPQTSGTGDDLNGVSFVDANNGWAVGGSGTIVHTSNGGVTWTPQTSGTGENLYGVSFVDPNNGWAVGGLGAIVQTSNGGVTWTPQTSNDGGEDLYGVSFVDPNNGWAVGGSPGLFDPGTIVHTSNGGVTWTPQTSPTTAHTYNLYSVSFVDANNGWAVGGLNFAQIVHTSDGGVTWTAQSSGTIYDLESVSFPRMTAPATAFLVRYVANLDVGDSFIDLGNDGQSAGPGSGNLCIGVYTFDANEELQSCCACLVTPNGLASLSAQAINATSLTGENATSLVVKLLAWSTTAGTSSTDPPGTPAPPTSSSCNPATPGTLADGMHAWGTTIHQLPSGGRSTYTVTETEFSHASLSAAEYAHITLSCEFNQINGSAQSGQCKGCTSGGQ